MPDKCPRCQGEVEILPKQVTEIFVSRPVLGYLPCYSPEIHLREQFSHEHIITVEKERSREENYRVKRLVYPFYCATCNSVWSPEHISGEMPEKQPKEDFRAKAAGDEPF